MISEHVNEMAARESEGGPVTKAKRRRIRRRVVQARCRLLLLSELGMWREWSWFGATQLRDMDETIAWQSTATVLDALLPKEEAKGGNDMVAFLGKGHKGKEFETKTVHKGKEFEKHFVENDDKRTTVQKGKEFETESAKDKPLPAPGHFAKPVSECIPQPFKDSNPADPVKYAGKPNKKRHVESCSGLQSLVGDVPQSVAETPDFRGDQVSEVIDMAFAKFTPNLVLNVEPLRSTVQAAAEEVWSAKAKVKGEEVQQLIMQIRTVCEKLHAFQRSNEKVYGVPCSICPSCPRAVQAEEGYGEWCEFCFHEVRPHIGDLSFCIACRTLVSAGKGLGDWCASCFQHVRPLIQPARCPPLQ